MPVVGAVHRISFGHSSAQENDGSGSELFLCTLQGLQRIASLCRADEDVVAVLLIFNFF
jgi:hypothetical protein